MKSSIVKRSVVVDGQRTSVSLEDPFWSSIREIAHAQRKTVSKLIADIDKTREQNNLSSAIRVFVLNYMLNRASGAVVLDVRDLIKREIERQEADKDKSR
jgi:predicted DNA-binding ribbon-helix-helix protein